MNSNKDLLQMDLYSLFDISSDASKKDITKAYRLKALKVHPDKNKDNPKAGEEFHLLSEALKILTDPAAKTAYDKLYAARKAHQERTNALNEKRKKMKIDLEAREQKAANSPHFPADSKESLARKQLEKEMDRLRKEFSAELEAEQTEMRRKIAEERRQQECKRLNEMGLSSEKVTPKFKVKWKSAKDDITNGGYTRDFIMKIFKHYGTVLNLLLSNNRKGTAVVEFSSYDQALKVYNASKSDVIGFPDNPLILEWIEGNQPREDSSLPIHQTGDCHSTSQDFKSDRSSTPDNSEYFTSNKPTLESMEASILSKMFSYSDNS